MKFSGLQILVTLAATALGATSNVIDLDADTFNDHVTAHDLVLAEFFAPWCGHCKNLAPEYEAAADMLKESGKDITLVKVDCTENQALCSEHEVQGFPTMHVFEKGERTGSYQGGRTANDITSYLLKRAEPAVVDLDSAKAFEDWYAAHAAEAPVLFAYFGAAGDRAAFDAAAVKIRDRASFVSVPDNEGLVKKYGGTVVVLRTDSDIAVQVKPLEGEPTPEAVAEFVDANMFPVFGELGPLTFAAYIQQQKPMLYAFVTSDEQRSLVKRSLTPHLDGLAGKANIVFLNATLYGQHANNLGMREEFPAMVVHEVTTNKKYPHSQDGDFDEQSIGTFVTEYLAGEIPVLVRSEPVPESQDEPVYTLVGTEYEKIVLDDDKDVLVEYYAPWCGHCKNLKPKYEELAELFQGNDNVVIAKLDHTLNDIPDDITGYPTIKLYPAGKKDEPIEFSGDRDVETLAKFIEENGTTASKRGAKQAKRDAKEETVKEAKEAKKEAKKETKKEAKKEAKKETKKAPKGKKNDKKAADEKKEL